MSDTFDHELDAYESLWNSDHPGAFGNNDEPDAERFQQFKNPKTFKCKFCGNDNLEWRNTAAGWRLVVRGSGIVHTCNRYRR